MDYLDKSLNSLERTKSLTSQLLTFAKGGEPIKIVDTPYWITCPAWSPDGKKIAYNDGSGLNVVSIDIRY